MAKSRASKAKFRKPSSAPKKMTVPDSRPGFTAGTLPFVARAGRAKKAEWLEKNREEYLREVVGPLTAIASHLKKTLGAAANGYHFPMRCLGRLKRSARGALEYGQPLRDYLHYTARRPSKSRFDKNPSLFLFVDPNDGEGDEVLLAGGLYMPSSRQLKSIRQALENDAGAFERLFKDKAFAASFPGGFSEERKAKRPPRGFDANHPKIEWLKLQGYFVWRSYRKKEYVSPKFADVLARDARQILRLNELLERAIHGRWVADAPARDRGTEGTLKRLRDLEETRAPRPMDF
jgi:uncharacterized protein (TIGR02453 family)